MPFKYCEVGTFFAYQLRLGLDSCFLPTLLHPPRVIIATTASIPAFASRGPFLYVYSQVTGKAGLTSLIHSHYRYHIIFGLSTDTPDSPAPGRLSETGDEQSGGILSLLKVCPALSFSIK